MKEILLLGMNGYIGRNLREHLDGIQGVRLTAPSSRELNLLNEQMVKECLQSKQFDVVINAAVGNRLRESFSTSASELEQDLRMFYNLEKYHDLYGRMLYFGSGAEFGKQKNISSVKETEFRNEIPLADYGFAKYVIGRDIEKSENIYNLRIFGLFGKYENWKTTFISGACCKALKGLPITIRQNAVFDYLYIDDFCRVVSWFLDHEPQYHTYNVTSGRKVDLVTVAETVKRLSGADVPIYVCKNGMANEYTASNNRLLKEYPQMKVTALDTAVKALLAYYGSILETVDIYSLLY